MQAPPSKSKYKRSQSLIRDKLPSLVLVCALVIGLFQFYSNVVTNDNTYDEIVFFEWSERLLQTGETERSYYFNNSKTPVNLVNVVGRDLAASILPSTSPRQKLTQKRIGGIIWYVGILLLVYLVCIKFIPTGYAKLASALIAVEPNIIAHSSLITSDAALAFFTILCVYSLIIYLQNRRVYNAIFLGASIGLLVMSKVTGVLVLAFMLLAWPAVALKYFDEDRVFYKKLLIHLPVIAATTILIINASYLFSGTMVRLDSIPFSSYYFQFVADKIGSFRSPLPKDFLTLYDILIPHEVARVRLCVLFMTNYLNGIWYYFIVNFLLKVPLALLAFIFFGLASMYKYVLSREKVIWLIALTCLLIFYYFSFIFTTQIGFRYILMILPLLLVLAMVAIARRRTSMVLLSAVFLLTVVESAPYFDNSLAFTNSFIPDKRYAYRVLSDSSLDWNQRHSRIKVWMHDNGVPKEALNPHPLRAGLNVIQLNQLVGVIHGGRYKWVLHNLDPEFHVEHTYLVFNVTDSQLEDYRKAQN